MKKIFLALAAILFSGNAVFAGGLLTNTNQSVLFLRNPARDAAIGIDGVYTNPAGVAFMSDGWHLSFNWQYAHQTRTITSAYGPLFAMNVNDPAPLSDDGRAYRRFKGVANAPVIPSVQAAYNKGPWSFQASVAISGGGGKCEFDNGLGSFEGLVGNMAQQIGMNGYSFNSMLKGQQYYIGTTVGAAYKVTPNLSVFGGLRVLYGTANYKAELHDIMLKGASTGNQLMPATTIFGNLKDQAAGAAQLYATLGQADKAAEYQAQAQELGALEIVTRGVDLDCDQTGIGIAPIIGIDYKIGRLNLAAKYDFKVRMHLKNKNENEAFNIIAAAVPQLERFKDGEKIDEDCPGLLTIGAQYEITDQWRVMAGYHHFFDVDTKQYTKDLVGDTNEFNFGTEYDINDWLQISAGIQKTNYDMEDGFMNDISFNVSSYTYGLGVGVKVTDKIRVNAAYFQTNYDTKDVVSGAISNSYTRTNRVFGLGCDIDF